LVIKRAYELLTKYKTNIILSNLGSPTTEALLPYVKSGKFLLAFPYSGSSEWRNREYSHFVHYRATYADESKRLIDYAVKELLIKNFAFFYQNDGKNGLVYTQRNIIKTQMRG